MPSLTKNPLLRAARLYSPKQPKLDEEPEESLLKRAGKGALSGISAVGNLLSVPGDVIRAAVTGGNPLTPLAHPFSSEGRVTGRDLLRKMGVIGKKDTYANFATGLAADILTDPTTYLTFGGSALSKGGQVARAAGLLKDTSRVASKAAGRAVGKRAAGMTTTLGNLVQEGGADAAQAAEKAAKGLGIDLANESDKPLRGLVGVGLPFRPPSFVLGTGQTAQKVAKGLDVAGAAIAGSAPGRAVRRLLDYRVKGTYTPASQALAERITDVEGAAKSAGYMKSAEYAKRLKEEIWQPFHEVYKGPLANIYKPDDDLARKSFDLADRLVRLTGETGGDVSRAVREVLPASFGTPSADLQNKIVNLGKDFSKVRDEVHRGIEEMGGYTAWVEQYVPRTGRSTGEGFSSSRIAPTAHEGMRAREAPIRDVPAEIVNQMSRDATTRGKGAAERIAARYGNYLSDKFGEVKDAAGNVVTQGSKERHASALAGWFRSRKELKDVFTGHTPDDMLRYMTGAETVRASMKVIHQTIAENITDGAGVTLPTLFRNSGMKEDTALQYLSTITKKSVDELKDMAVPVDVAKAIQAHTELTTVPEWQSMIGSAVDYVNGIFKRAVTLPFPSFAARNLTGGQANNMLSGEITSAADVALYSAEAKRMASVMKNPPEDLITELVANRAFDPRSLGQGVESAEQPLGTMTKRIVEGSGLASPLDIRKSFQASQEQVAAAGSLGKVADAARAGYGTLEEVGARTNHMVEFLNRATMYEYLKKKGWSPAAAAEKVRELQVDYSALSPFEKTFVRRLVPFYSWQRRMAPVIFQQLAERPGGATAQTVKAINRARKEDATTPDYIAGSASIPLPSGTPGVDRYLTGFGLPLESPLSYIGGGLRGAGLEALSQLNPLVKAPLEWSTGQSFFQKGPQGGRPIEDLDPTVGRLLSNVAGREKPVKLPAILEAAIANSPATRFLTSARVATDPRKGIAARASNLLTGFKVTDVPPQTQDALIRENVQKLLRQAGGRSFVNISVPADELAKMPPQEQQRVRELQNVLAILAKRAKARKAASKN